MTMQSPWSIDELRSRVAALPRVSLSALPTPMVDCPRLSGQLGEDVRILFKRDDLTSLGCGGNKIRKLEFLLAEALDQGCSSVLTFGGLGLLVASRAQTTVGVSGLMNLAMVPMWIGSGTFFSTSRFPDAMQPFVQIKQGYDSNVQGTGLGLPLTKKLVELHGGRFEMKSAPAEGTTITIRLPAARPETAAAI